MRALAKAGKIHHTKHADIRDPRRGKFPLTREQIANCLLVGTITEGPAPDIKLQDGWKLTVTRFKADEKHEVAAVLVAQKSADGAEEYILVITGYGWAPVKRARK